MKNNKWWLGSSKTLINSLEDLAVCVKNITSPLFIIKDGEQLFYSENGNMICSEQKPSEYFELRAYCAPLTPEQLGDTSFCRDYGIRYPYIGGSMAYGISSLELAHELHKTGCLGFIGTGGLDIPTTEKIIKDLNSKKVNFGCNLIFVPSAAQREMDLVNLYIKENVKYIEASAYLDVTEAIVKYRAKGLYINNNGRIESPVKIIVKASRVEVAEKFLSPAPSNILKKLVQSGEITQQEADLAEKISIADDITAEADSGGHTDGRPAMPLFSSFIALRDRMKEKSGRKVRVGFGGGIGTPHAAAAAFAMGAAYIVTGSINQACIESGTSPLVREMLANARQADTATAPSADMFDIGGKVQVLKAGTLFPMRAQRLLSIYNLYDSIEDLSDKDRDFVEKTVLRDTIENVWQKTKDFFSKRSTSQLEAAMQSPKYKMALIFRYYLGLSSKWAINGEQDRKIDFQIWSGPAIGAFNEWTKNTFLSDVNERKAQVVTNNILHGACVLSRMNTLSAQGVNLFSEIALTPERY